MGPSYLKLWRPLQALQVRPCHYHLASYAGRLWRALGPGAVGIREFLARLLKGSKYQLPGDPFLAMTCFLIRGSNILPQKELHSIGHTQTPMSGDGIPFKAQAYTTELHGPFGVGFMCSLDR